MYYHIFDFQKTINIFHTDESHHYQLEIKFVGFNRYKEEKFNVFEITEVAYSNNSDTIKRMTYHLDNSIDKNKFKNLIVPSPDFTNLETNDKLKELIQNLVDECSQHWEF